MFPSTLGGPAMRWYSELLARSIDYFGTLANLFTNTYSAYCDVHKCREAMFRLLPQTRDSWPWWKNHLTHWRPWYSSKVSTSNSPLSQKLNKKKYDYTGTT
ncbi:hypothetical protein DVH24_002166 [Malus domestica]|uniref:Retrotransposon gag domain-containing protein n=1 Tax=Malus domestica TaxID=3750 RepID=A0A498I4H5_MALDO|nr:hypothetical protein DVH24_002166 [Malus domestica]